MKQAQYINKFREITQFIAKDTLVFTMTLNIKDKSPEWHRWPAIRAPYWPSTPSVFIYNYHPIIVIEKLRGPRHFDGLIIGLSILNPKPTRLFSNFFLKLTPATYICCNRLATHNHFPNIRKCVYKKNLKPGVSSKNMRINSRPIKIYSIHFSRNDKKKY